MPILDDGQIAFMPDKPFLMLGAGGHAQMMMRWLAEEWLVCSTEEHQVNRPTLGLHWVVPAQEALLLGPEFLGFPVLEEESLLASASTVDKTFQGFFTGVGMLKPSPWRQSLIEGYSERWAILGFQHPSATLSRSARLGAGLFIGPQTVIQPEASLGDYSLINTGSIVEHHVTIGQNTHLAPGSIVCGHSEVGDHSLVGAFAVILQGLTIASHTTIGAGSVVTKSLQGQGQRLTGIPAR